MVNVALASHRPELDAGVQRTCSGRSTPTRWRWRRSSCSAGRSVDHFGRRRIFVIGVAVVLAGLARLRFWPRRRVLIAARALQGVGGRAADTGSLALISASFQSRTGPAAIGAWAGLAASPPRSGRSSAGGWSTGRGGPSSSSTSPRIAGHVGRSPARAGDPRPTGDRPRRARAPALVRSASGADQGLSRLGRGATAVVLGSRLRASPLRRLPRCRAAVAAPDGAARAFRLTPVQRRERRRPCSCTPPWRRRSSCWCCSCRPCRASAPLAAGTSLLPFTVFMFLFSARGGALARRIGPRLPMTVGPLVSACGLLLLLRVGPGASWLTEVLPAMVVFGAGMTLTVSPLTATVLDAAPDRFAGLRPPASTTRWRAQRGCWRWRSSRGSRASRGDAYTDPVALNAGFRMSVLISAGPRRRRRPSRRSR